MNNKKDALIALKNNCKDIRKVSEIWDSLSSELQEDMDLREIYLSALAYVPAKDKDSMGSIIDTSEESLEESNAYWNSLQGRTR